MCIEVGHCQLIVAPDGPGSHPVGPRWRLMDPWGLGMVAVAPGHPIWPGLDWCDPLGPVAWHAAGAPGFPGPFGGGSKVPDLDSLVQVLKGTVGLGRPLECCECP